MKNLLNSVKIPTVKKSFFDLSYEHKTSFNMGSLIPIGIMPVVPSDRVNVSCSAMCRFAPMIAPMMHNVNVYTYSFFVPYRLLWRGTTANNRWNDYIANIKTAGVLPSVPTINFEAGTTQPGTLANYLNIPIIDPDRETDLKVVAFNAAAYQCIWNEYFRDQNLQGEADYLLIDGDNSSNADLYQIRKKAWEKDYFTAALPFAQKGDDVMIPMSGTDVAVMMEGTGPGSATWSTTGGGGTAGVGVQQSDIPGFPNGSLFANTSEFNSSSTINDLRVAYTLQRWYEQLARGGTRPNEFLKVMFNVNSPDKRLQRPEFISSSSSPIMVSEVLNTTGTEDAPQGSMAGHGVGLSKGRNGSYFVEEYGVVMTLMCVLPRTGYFQGLPKEYFKYNDPTEYFMPTFDHLGEQEVLQGELVIDATSQELTTFGYVPRYCEYKYPTNRVTGQFQTTLDFWHMARKFSTDGTNPPFLNADFVESNPTTRVFAVTDDSIDHVMVSAWNEFKLTRPMSKYSTPTF